MLYWFHLSINNIAATKTVLLLHFWGIDITISITSRCLEREDTCWIKQSTCAYFHSCFVFKTDTEENNTVLRVSNRDFIICTRHLLNTATGIFFAGLQIKPKHLSWLWRWRIATEWPRRSDHRKVSIFPFLCNNPPVIHMKIQVFVPYC